MAPLSQALPLGSLLPPHSAFEDMLLTVRDGPHRLCPKAHGVPVHPMGFLHSYGPLTRHTIRSSHAPRGHSLRLVGSPSAAWKPVSLRTIMRPSTCRISH